ncbi:hypothetical protein BN1318_2770002 [Staphylococcus capitis]|nr:hypothetical protein BN1318_2770002 [Staphylococcus capitis]
MYELYNLKSYNELQDLYDVFIPSKVKKDYEEEDIIECYKRKNLIFSLIMKKVFIILLFITLIKTLNLVLII